MTSYRACQSKRLVNKELEYDLILQSVCASLKNLMITQIALPTVDGCEYVPIKRVLRLEADGNYTRLHFINEGYILISKTLLEFDRLLVHHGFFRIHRSHLINLSYLKQFCKGRQTYVVMENGENITVSKRKKEDFIAYLNAQYLQSVA